MLIPGADFVGGLQTVTEEKAAQNAGEIWDKTLSGVADWEAMVTDAVVQAVKNKDAAGLMDEDMR